MTFGPGEKLPGLLEQPLSYQLHRQRQAVLENFNAVRLTQSDNKSWGYGIRLANGLIRRVTCGTFTCPNTMIRFLLHMTPSTIIPFCFHMSSSLYGPKQRLTTAKAAWPASQHLPCHANKSYPFFQTIYIGLHMYSHNVCPQASHFDKVGLQTVGSCLVFNGFRSQLGPPGSQAMTRQP